MPDAEFDELDISVEQLSVPLRLGEGFHEPAYERLCAVLRRINDRFADSSEIPKRLAMALIELGPALESSLSLYHGSEEERLTKAIVDIYDLSLDCVKSPDSD